MEITFHTTTTLEPVQPIAPTQLTSIDLWRGFKRKLKVVDVWVPKTIRIPRNLHRRFDISFEPYTHLDAWIVMVDDEWATAISLEVFYHFNWPQPRSELILDFVEGSEYVQPTRGTRRAPSEQSGNIRSMIRGKPVEISAYVIRIALGFEDGVD